MKKLIYIMLSLCCLVFYSCGMTEPWKDWEHEGDMSADRLRPSEVKELLCAADGWKMIYQGVTFYFQFDEEGIQKLLDAYNGDVKELLSRLEAVVEAGKEYQTFTKVADGTKGSVKFVLRTEGIKSEEGEEE